MITAYILGIATVVVIFIGMVAYDAFVKVKKLAKELESSERTFEKQVNYLESRFDNNVQNVHQRVSDEIREVRQDLDRLEREFQSALDSRLDRLEIKLTTKK